MISVLIFNNKRESSFILKISVALLVVHVVPVYPAAQVHVYLFTPSLHFPPFLHGLLAHSLISTVKRYYENDKRSTYLTMTNMESKCEISVSQICRFICHPPTFKKPRQSTLNVDGKKVSQLKNRVGIQPFPPGDQYRNRSVWS